MRRRSASFMANHILLSVTQQLALHRFSRLLGPNWVLSKARIGLWILFYVYAQCGMMDRAANDSDAPEPTRTRASW